MILKKINKGYVFVLLMFFIFLILALIIPFDHAPDEAARYLLAQYMFKYKAMPVGCDPEVRIPLWGTSYAFSPFFSYMVSSFLMTIMSWFTQDSYMLLFSARLASVFFSTFTIILIIKISEELFEKEIRWVFVILCSCLPTFAFVSSYVNCDSLAVLSTSIIIYSWILGLKNFWDKKSCLLLILGLSLCVLSYKNTYGYIVVTILIYILETFRAYKRNQFNIMVKKGIIVFFFVFMFSGWFYIRNYYLYGSFMGNNVSEQLRELYAIDILKPSNILTPMKSGYSLWYMLFDMNWLEITYKSFIGVFDNMSLEMPSLNYTVFNCVFMIGLFGIIKSINDKDFLKEKKLIIFSFASIIVITFVLSVYYSYTNDFQAQGRYLLPGLIPFMYFVTKGIQKSLSLFNLKNRIVIITIVSSLIVYLLISIILNVFVYAYV